MGRRSVWKQAEKDSDLTIELPGGVPMFFRKVAKGSFRMGSRGESAAETPIHRVVIPEDFYLGTFVVTQEQWAAVARGSEALKDRVDPSEFKGRRRPVENVSWEDAQAWLHAMNELADGNTAAVHAQLPNEAQWEYACRGGATAIHPKRPHYPEADYYAGDGIEILRSIAWFDENTGETPHPVDQRREEHPLGLHGMHGNVWEWLEDVWDAKAYRKRSDGWYARAWTAEDAGMDADYSDDDGCVDDRPNRVQRGGLWSDPAYFSRSAVRSRDHQGYRYWCGGFRVCLVRGPVEDRKTASQPTGAERPAKDGGDGTEPKSQTDRGAEVPDLAKARFPR